jgi:uncharacterized SAM-binding protein YcdF (DUF218 family)
VFDSAKIDQAPKPPESESPPRAETSRPPRWALYVSGALALVAAVCLFALLSVGRWLVYQDPLQQAHAIVVLSGHLPDRAMEAARIYRQDYSAQVWVSQGVSPAAILQQMHIAYVGEDFYNQRVLMAQAVPADAIRILMDPSANTEQEVDEIARDLRREEAHAVIIVTSKAHTRRVRLIWNKRVGKDPRAIVRYATDDSFDPGHWWRSTSDALDVVREVLGIANALAGFPLQAEPRTP